MIQKHIKLILKRKKWNAISQPLMWYLGVVAVII
jgi:hypothetical protein